MGRRLHKLASIGVASALALACGASAAPAAGVQRDRSYGTVEVRVRGANIRTGPGMDSSVVTVVHGGRLLPVLGRSARWIRVGLDDGGTGWIHGSLVAPTAPAPGTPEAGSGRRALAEDHDLRRFRATVERVDERVRRAAGVGVFAGVERAGDGAVELTAAEAWLAATEAERRANLDTLFRLWDAAHGPGAAPVVIRIVDHAGGVLMEERRGAESADAVELDPAPGVYADG